MSTVVGVPTFPVDHHKAKDLSSLFYSYCRELSSLANGFQLEMNPNESFSRSAFIGTMQICSIVALSTKNRKETNTTSRLSAYWLMNRIQGNRISQPVPSDCVSQIMDARGCRRNRARIVWCLVDFVNQNPEIPFQFLKQYLVYNRYNLFCAKSVDTLPVIDQATATPTTSL